MQLRCVLRALTPVAHGDTRTGIDNASNVRLFMTQPTCRNGRLIYTPHVSENALRSVLLRRPLADHLLRTLDVPAGAIGRPVLSLLYAGGRMGGARAPGDETQLGHRIKQLYPSLDLLGGAVDAFILPRSRLRLCAWLVAEEYLDAIEPLFPELVGEAKSRSAHDLVGEEVRTRGLSAEGDNQMLYSYETLAAGTRIAIELTLDDWTPAATTAALARGLTEWDGFIGGQGRQGRGRCALDWLDDAPSPDAYDAHLQEHHNAMREGLTGGTLGVGRVLCAAAA